LANEGGIAGIAVEQLLLDGLLAQVNVVDVDQELEQPLPGSAAAGVGLLLRGVSDGRSTGPLFVTTTGRRLDQPEAWRMIRRLARRVSLDGAGKIRPHSLRVAFITGARGAGVPLEDVQDAAGYADPRTTRRYDRGRHSLDRHASYAVTTWLKGPE
jgi:integrase